MDVLAVGGAAVDLVLRLDRLPGYDEKVLADLVGWLPGGPATNFACAASRLGLNVTSLCIVGDDASGQLVREDLARFGVDTSLVQVVEDARTNFTVIMADPTGEKAIVVVPMLENVYPPGLVESALARTRLLYMMPSDEGLFTSLARTARASGAEVMVDLEATVVTDRAALRRVLSEVDIASFNSGGFLTATGEDPTFDAARRLLAEGPHTVVATEGAEGSLAVTAETAARWPGYRVPTVDSTGAGDTFNAAFVWATLKGLELEQRLRFANAAAALSVTGLGPRGRLPSQEEVESFILAYESGREPAA